MGLPLLGVLAAAADTRPGSRPAVATCFHVRARRCSLELVLCVRLCSRDRDIWYQKAAPHEADVLLGKAGHTHACMHRHTRSHMLESESAYVKKGQDQLSGLPCTGRYPFSERDVFMLRPEWQTESGRGPPQREWPGRKP